jgi:lactate dehydrogenase-like 2-hydroxyacid dehydrogenase
LEGLKAYGVQPVALRSTGFNNVDVEKAKELDLEVVRVPAYSPHAIAEHAVGLILIRLVSVCNATCHFWKNIQATIIVNYSKSYPKSGQIKAV